MEETHHEPAPRLLDQGCTCDESGPCEVCIAWNTLGCFLAVAAKTLRQRPTTSPSHTQNRRRFI